MPRAERHGGPVRLGSPDLPPPLSAQFWDEVTEIEEERKVPFITTPERIGREMGRREGILFSIEQVLRTRFGEEAAQALTEIGKLTDEDRLAIVLQSIATANSLEEASRAWTAP